MRRSKEELGKLHKEQCRELKTIRAQMAADLGIDLKQRECTYEGYCSGTKTDLFKALVAPLAQSRPK